MESQGEQQKLDIPPVGSKRYFVRNDEQSDDQTNQENSQVINEETAAKEMEKQILEQES